jgi:TatD DNase family protein
MIDIGVNLTNKRFDNDYQEIISNAVTAGIKALIITGTNLEHTKKAIGLCERFSNMYCTAGIHPHDASSLNADSFAAITSLAAHEKVVAIGETGLDFNRNFSSKDQQISAFEKQIELAITTQKPLFLHERDAFKEQYSILKNNHKDLSGAVVHCFTGDTKALESYLELNFHIGITGWVCDERRGIELQSLVKTIPDDKLLIETDAPYLTPRTLSGKAKKSKNQPANLIHIAQFIAHLRQQSVNHITNTTTANARHLFCI